MNIGAGAITANYDDIAKHRTEIGDEVHTGSHNVFVAPVRIGDGAKTGAGAVIRKDVPAGALALSVAPQRNVEGWVETNRPGTGAADGRGRRLGPHRRRTMARKRKTVDLDRENDIAPGLVAKTKKRLVVGAGRSHPALAADVAEPLGTELVPTEYRTFAIRRDPHPLRGVDPRLRLLPDPELRPARQRVAHGDAHHAGCRQARIGQADHRRRAVLPYSRQDKKGRGREPISARLVADLFKTAGADRVMSVDLHAAQIQGFFDGPVDHLFAKPVLAGVLRAHADRRRPREPHRRLARHRPRPRRRHLVGQVSARRWRSSTSAATRNVANQVTVQRDRRRRSSGRVCLLVDDMIDTGGTIVKAAEALKKNGARAGHRRRDARDLQRPGPERLQSDAIDEVVVTDTAPDPGGQALPDRSRPADRAAAGPGHPRGLRRRLGHEHVRRRRVGAPMTISTPRPWLSSYAAGVPTDLPPETGSLADLIRGSVETYPDNVALEFFGRATTTPSSATQIERAAEGLRRLGVQKGDRVALVLPNCPQHIVAFYAVLRLGAIVVEHNPLYTPRELRHQFEDHGARVASSGTTSPTTVAEFPSDIAVRPHRLGRRHPGAAVRHAWRCACRSRRPARPAPRCTTKARGRLAVGEPHRADADRHAASAARDVDDVAVHAVHERHDRHARRAPC